MKTFYALLLSLLTLDGFAQTSWKGTTSTDWNISSNWTAGIPTSNIDVIIGDANFTGTFQPTLTGTTANCKTLTIGNGNVGAVLSITKNINVSGNVTIGNNGTILNNTPNYIITVKGNWTNTGIYTATATTASVTFSGTAQTISGNTNFNGVTINSGSTVTLAANIAVTGTLNISGTFDPTSAFTVNGAGALNIDANGTILVKSSTFGGNYALTGAVTIDGTGTINYASSTLNQIINNTLTYGYLRISGGMEKTLAGNLPALNSTSNNAGRIYVDAGTLNLSSFTANRGTGVPGGSITIAANAVLKIAGTNSFPFNYNTINLASTCTVYFSGTNQIVPKHNYGNLVFESSTGVAVKTMPVQALTIAGDFICATGNGTGVTFTAGDKITVNKNVVLGTGVTFNASSHTHTFKANWSNNGTFTGATSTVLFKGTNAVLSGTGANNFFDVKFQASGITASGTTPITVSGNISTTNAGLFTHNTGGTTTLTGASKNITGNGLKFYNLIISGSYSTSSSFLVSGNFTSNGTFTASGSSVITLNGSSKNMDGTGSIIFSGLNIQGDITTNKNFTLLSSLSVSVSVSSSFTATAGTAIINGISMSFSGTANLYDVNILAGKTLRLGSNSNLGIANTFTKTGTLNVTSSTPNTVTYNSNAAQNIISTTYNNLVLTGAGLKTPTQSVIVNNDFFISAGVSFTGVTYTHTIKRNFTNNGTFTPATSSFVFSGSNATYITGTTSFNTVSVNKNSMLVAVNLNNNITVASLDMASGNMQTATNSVTITSARTGSGIIIGTITRNHTFVSGTPYYFEGPENSIAFTNPVGIGSVTIKVIPGLIADFDPAVECVNREYEISLSSGTYTSANFRFHYNDNELNAFVEPFLTLYKFNTGIVWDSLGFTSRNITTNYVELTGLTSLPGRYTASGIRNIIRWNGSVNSDWELAANWTTYSGIDTTNRVPTSTDGVEIGTAAFVNQPNVNSTRSCAILRFGSLQPVTLTINSNALTVVGSVRGIWSTNASHTINVAAATLNVGTHIDLSDGTNGHDISLKIGNGTTNVTHDIVQSATGDITFTGSGNLILSGHYIYTGGNFTAGTGTVTYTSGAEQTIAPITYNHLSFTKTTDRAVSYSPITINGNLSITTGGEVELNGNATIAGNVSIAPTTALIENGITINVGGNWTNLGFFDISTGTVNFNGAGTQFVNANTFNNFIVNKSSGILTLTANQVINSDLTLTTGTLNLATFTADRSVPGGTLTLGAGSLMLVGGTSNFPKYYVAQSVHTTSTVEYNAAIAQEILNINYGNLTLTNGGAIPKSSISDFQITGDLLINSGATIDPDSTTVKLSGNFTNNGTWLPAGSTLILNGISKTFSGNTNLFDMSVIGGSYSVSTGNIYMMGDFYVDTLSSFNFGSNNVTLDGDLTNKGSLISNGTATFTGTRVQTLQLLNAITSSSTGIINFNGTVAPVFNSNTSPSFATVNINNTAGVAPSVSWTVFVAMNVAANASFDGSALTHTFYGNFTNHGVVTSSGELRFIPGAPFSASANIKLDGVSFASTGIITFGGTAPISITDINPYLNEVRITNTNSAGITPPNNWIINGELFIGPGATFRGGAGLSHTLIQNLTNNGMLDGQTSACTFMGNPAFLNGIGVTTFYDLTLATASSVTLNKSIGISRDFVVNGLFTGTGRTVKFTGAIASTISGTTSPVTFDDLEQDKTGATTTLLIPVIVTNVFTLTNGIVNTTAANLLTLTDGATSTAGNATSFVNGPMQKIGNDAFVFPLGNSTFWARLEIGAPTSVTDAFTAQYFANAYGNTVTMSASPAPALHHVSTVEYWTCDRTNGNSNVAVKLYWEDAGRSGISNYSDLTVARWNGSAWENMGQGAVTSANPGNITSNLVTAFSPFTFGTVTGVNILPIELISFNATVNGSNTVDINWATASETDNDYFVIEKTADGYNFETVCTIQSNGNSSVLQTYGCNDANPYSGNSYYRLKQVDLNGAYSYSDLDAVHMSTSTISVYPTMFETNTPVSVNGLTSAHIMHITDMSGKIVYTTSLSDYNNTIYLQVSTGMYQYMLVQNDEIIKSGKILIK